MEPGVKGWERIGSGVFNSKAVPHIMFDRDIEKRVFTCEKCGARTCCEGHKDGNWVLETDRCICGNTILIKRPQFEVAKYLLAKQKED